MVIFFQVKLFSLKQEKECQDNLKEATGLAPWSVTEEVFNVKFLKKRPKWLINDKGNRMELDGYNEDLRIAFEYQGRQHFEIVSHFKDTKKDFAKRQKHDKIKKEICLEKNILLLCPTYELDEKDYRYFIYESMKNYGG
jgi:hypothetical protein